MRRRLEPDVLTGLLELTAKAEEARISELAARCRLSAEVTEKILVAVPEVGFEGPRVFPVRGRRIQLALRAVRIGADQAKVARLLSWKDFEIFCSEVFAALGYQTATNVRLKFLGRRMEIDLVGQRYSNLVAVDCKHWKNVLSGRRLGTVVDKQHFRAGCLAGFLREHWGPGEVCVRVLPAVLCLYEPRQRFFNGSPLVSVINLPSFAEQLPAEIAGLRTHKVGLSRTPDIGEIVQTLKGMRGQTTLRPA